MSFISRLQTAMVFMITIGASCVAAQTPATKSLVTKPLVEAASNSKNPLDAEHSENVYSRKTSAVNRDFGNPNPFASLRTPSAKSTTSPTTPLPQNADDDGWHFQATPYFWLAGLHGIGGVGNRTAGVEMSFGDVFGALNFAAMGTFEARKRKFVSLTDLEYVSVSDDRATPGPFFSSVDAGFKTFIFDQEVGYRVYENGNGASIDVLGGARVWRVKSDFEFGAGILPAVRIEGSRSWVDAVGGLRGKAPLSKKVFLTGKFDLGGGGSQFTWQAFGGAGYSIKDNIALIFGYRALDVDYNKNNFVYDMNQRGPIFGMGFKF